MLFESPIWLCGLLPWAVVVVYLLIGCGQPAVVPFLRFWKGPVRTSHKRSWRAPPMFIQLMLLATLLAVLAAAQPGYGPGAPVDGDITIVLDCGATMARPGDGRLFRGVLDKAARELGVVRGKVSMIPVPGQRVETTGENWVATATQMLPAAIPVKLDQVVAEQLHQTRGLVVVLSDQPLLISDPRIVQIVPDPPKPAVAITLLAARAQPHPQVMVRLENHSDLKTVHVVVKSGSAMSDQRVPLPTNGKSDDYFFDLGSANQANQIVTSEIVPHVQADPWGKAFLVRQSNGVGLSSLGQLSVSVERMLKVYSKDRPAGPDARDVFISNHALGEEQPGIWIDNSPATDAAGEVVAAPHAVTKNVKLWPAKGRHGSAPPGFTPVVSIGHEPLVAVRENPVRQVWIRADLSDWEKTVDFVIFFGNALDWIADADQQYTSIGPTILGADWKSVDGFPGAPTGAWPGIFRSEAGRFLAVNAGEYPSIPAATDTTAAGGTSQKITRISSLLPAAIYAALLCMLLAAFAWPSTKTVADRYARATEGS